MEVGILTPDTRIENEECVYCFNDFDDPEGVNICLKCFTCCCTEHAKQHYKEREHNLFLSRRRITTKSEADPNKLAIGVEGGFDDVKHTFEFELRMFDENGFQVLPEEIVDTEEAQTVIDKIKKAPSASCADMVKSWELKIVECEHVKNLQQPSEKIPPRPCKCSDCDLDKNLWLCLTCGHIGCGRKNFDGSGGNNHAVDHWEQTHHPVVVKLGTISPDGRADLYCYQCDETVTDSKIHDHLAKFSIDVAKSVKTESTTTELNVQINKNWDFDTVTADGKEYETMTGPFSVGLKNLGNTCYMNSILQTLANIQPFVEDFLTKESATARWNEPKRQFNRLFTAMKQGDRQKVSPRILREVVCRDNPQFMSGQQQDACEFFLYLSEYIRVHNPGTSLNLSTFDSIQFNKCANCDAPPSAIQMKDQNILLLVPPRQDPDSPEVTIPIKDLLAQSLVHQNPDIKCDKCKGAGAVAKTYLKNFPDYLFVSVMLDTITNSGMVKKMNINVEFDPENFDISDYKVKPEDEAAATGPTVDENKVAELLNFGFSRAQAVRALENVNSVEEAVDWIVEHPMEQSPNVATVMEMGFSENEAREALEECQGNVALAIEWLFGPRIKKNTGSGAKKTDGNGVYELIAFVQHKGPSALCGHYVANVKRNGKWILYNDEKVAIYPDDVKPQFGKGYLYLFKRK
ncbi:Ubiquitin carboxyl-terminal hydrolase 5 [Tritrichomonas musculus]|uniref:Ubiquitin carboxyl-terminal hydrolase n=1 Tax=Tritrichomonas musculus TaxID=1915356 RepID=A0ABR2INE3_9EUKA